MASRQHNLRPASARRIPQRYKNRDKEEERGAQPRALSRNHNPTFISSVQPQNSDLGKYCAFPSRPLNDPDPGPSELVKATRECFTSGKREELERKLRAADSPGNQGEQKFPKILAARPRSRVFPELTSEKDTGASTPTSPRMALVARLPPMESGLGRSSDDMDSPFVGEEIYWGSDSDDEPPHAYSSAPDAPLSPREVL
ncbi:hypothetical protein J3458_005041 [Metarhizium acridum]|nr:hypothetical protein J3458_005041 [Metarhizium acridum]